MDRKPFAEALADLCAEYADLGPEALLGDLERMSEGLEDDLLGPEQESQSR